MKTIAIIIPNHRRPELLDRVLESISKAILPPSFIGVWVVENGEKCGAINVCNKWSDILCINYLYADKANVSNARNAGAKSSEADFIIFFDDDVRCDTETIVAYDIAIQKYGESRFYGGPLDIDYEEIPPEWLINFLPWSVQGMNKGDMELEITEPIFLGGNHAVHRLTLLSLGGYDGLGASGKHNHGAVGEETRLQSAMLNQNIHGCYIPKSVVWHYVPKENCSIEWSLMRRRRHGFTAGVLYRKQNNKDIIIMNIPRWLLKKMIVLKLKIILTSVFFCCNEAKKYRAKSNYHNIKGFIEGYSQF